MKTATLGAVSPEAALQSVLERLSGVAPYGESFKALCPAHADRRPSLSVKLGYRGILLKCWAGCSLSEICRAIDLPESELFFDSPVERFYKNNGTVYEKANLNYRWNWRRQINEILNITETQAVLAQDFLVQVKTLDSATLTNEQRDSLLNLIPLAWSWLRLGESVADLCFMIAQQQRRMEAAQ